MSLAFLIPAYIALYLLGAGSLAAVIGLTIKRAERQAREQFYLMALRRDDDY